MTFKDYRLRYFKRIYIQKPKRISPKPKNQNRAVPKINGIISNIKITLFPFSSFIDSSALNMSEAMVITENIISQIGDPIMIKKRAKNVKILESMEKYCFIVFLIKNRKILK